MIHLLIIALDYFIMHELDQPIAIAKAREIDVEMADPWGIWFKDEGTT